MVVSLSLSIPHIIVEECLTTRHSVWLCDVVIHCVVMLRVFFVDVIRHVGVSLSMRSYQLYDVKMTTSHAVDCFKLSFFGKNTISRNKLFNFIQNKNN